MRKKLVVSSLLLIIVTIGILAMFVFKTHPLRVGLANDISGSADIKQKISDSKNDMNKDLKEANYTLPFKSDSGKLVASFDVADGHGETDYEFNINDAEILAVSSGIVVDNGFNEQGAGYYITVEDEYANFVTYKHLATEEDILRIGEEVIRGKQLSTAGRTGNVSPSSEKAIVAIQINKGSVNGELIDFETLL